MDFKKKASHVNFLKMLQINTSSRYCTRNSSKNNILKFLREFVKYVLFSGEIVNTISLIVKLIPRALELLSNFYLIYFDISNIAHENPRGIPQAISLEFLPHT